MAYLGAWQIDDLITFAVTTHAPATGALVDADSVPSYQVYEDETGAAILTGNMGELDDSNTTGLYSEQLTLSAVNGFEVGKAYTVFVTAVVGGVTGGTTRNFQVVDAPATAAALGTADDAVLLAIAALNNLGSVEAQAAAEAALTAYDAATGTDVNAATSGLPTATEIADAILSRGVGNVEDTADAHSLAAIVLATLESLMSGTTWTIYKTNGVTPFTTKTLTVDANADPVVGAA